MLFPLIMSGKFALFLCTNADQILNKNNNRNRYHIVYCIVKIMMDYILVEIQVNNSSTD